ncbi:Endoplasmin [Aphelenchoides besseyi]|nr:Endoplasmin [Aphelenchoides besseyi]
MASKSAWIIWSIFLILAAALVLSPLTATAEEDDIDEEPKVKESLAKGKVGSKTDDEVVQREEEAIQLDGLSVSEVKKLREKAEKHEFQAEVKIFLRELISNASDALDKIRLMSLTDPSVLSSTEELSIRIKADKDNHILKITDTGIGMTRQDLVNNLGTIARSGTAEFMSKVLETATSAEQQQDLIGQFGVGFYSAFLVADRVVVATKNNDDKQLIWESDSSSFSIVEDPRGNTLKRGTEITLYLKAEAYDFLEPDTLKKLVHKYSQFINFDIYLWESKTVTVDEPVEDEEPVKTEEEGEVKEETDEEAKPKTKSVEKTVWDWNKVNNLKPIWLRKPNEVTDDEYKEFYKSLVKDYDEPLGQVHFTAEGEVAFKSILYVPKRLPQDAFQNYGKTGENIKLYVRRVFITDDFQDMLPKYLSFIRGLVDSDDLPLNVSRENLQQHKLLKLIKKKLVRKVLDIKWIKKTYDDFWKEYSTNIKLGIMEDPTNRNRLSKLLRFETSHDAEKPTTLDQYVERMKEKQESIFYIAGTSRAELESSPFVEALLKKGYEVLYLTEPFLNLAKEGLKLNQGEKAKEVLEQLEKQYDPLIDWLRDKGLKNKIEKAVISERLTKSPSALVASSYGWSGNMERIMKSQAYAKAKDPTQDFYANQKKIFEINPRHPVVKELLRRIEADQEDPKAYSTAQLLFETATLRSGYSLQDQVGFAERIETILRQSLDIGLDDPVEEEHELEEETVETEKNDEEKTDEVKVEEEHTEL